MRNYYFCDIKLLVIRGNGRNDKRGDLLWVDVWVNPAMPDITAFCFVHCKFIPVANFSEMNDAKEAQSIRACASTNAE